MEPEVAAMVGVEELLVGFGAVVVEPAPNEPPPERGALVEEMVVCGCFVGLLPSWERSSSTGTRR